MLRTEVVALDAIEPNPDNPRKDFDEDGLAALAKTFAFTPERPGEPFTPPVVVKRPGRRKRPYMIVDGERRWRAMKAAGEVRECTCTVADDMDEANALVAMICTDSKEPLTDEEKSMGVQQALLLELDDEDVDAIAMLPAGTAAKARRAVRVANRPVQCSLQALVDAADIEDDDLYAKAVDAAGERGMDAMRPYHEIQRHRSARRELITALYGAGAEVYDEDEADESDLAGLFFVGTAWNSHQVGNFDFGPGAVVAAVVSMVDEKVDPEDRWYYRRQPHAALYGRAAEDEAEDDAEERAEQARREQLKGECEHEFAEIEKRWAEFAFDALEGGVLEYDPDLDEPTALQQIVEGWYADNITRDWREEFPEPDVTSLDGSVLPLLWSTFDVGCGMWTRKCVWDEDYKPDKADLDCCADFVAFHEALCDLGYEPGGYEAGAVSILRAHLAGDGEEE